MGAPRIFTNLGWQRGFPLGSHFYIGRRPAACLQPAVSGFRSASLVVRTPTVSCRGFNAHSRQQVLPTNGGAMHPAAATEFPNRGDAFFTAFCTFSKRHRSRRSGARARASARTVGEFPRGRDRVVGEPTRFERIRRSRSLGRHGEDALRRFCRALARGKRSLPGLASLVNQPSVHSHSPEIAVRGESGPELSEASPA